jgi:hypothetical protein
MITPGHPILLLIEKFLTNVSHRTYIFTFDSVYGRHPVAVRKLTDYLEMEALDKRNVKVPGMVEYKVALVSYCFHS